MAPLTLDVDGRDVVFTEPAKARAAGRRWTKMARELDSTDAPPDAKTKVRELRARAKAAHDWARHEEDREPVEPHERDSDSEEADQPAGAANRRRAAAALTETGIRRGKRGARASASAVRQTRGKAVDVTSWGEFAIFFLGSLIGMVLLDDVLSSRGSTAVGSSAKAAAGIAHRIIEPVPIVKAN